MKRSTYHPNNENPFVLVLNDLGGDISVGQDVPNILNCFEQDVKDGRRIIFSDSSGYWYGIGVDGHGNFSHIIELGDRLDVHSAIDKALSLMEW